MTRHPMPPATTRNSGIAPAHLLAIGHRIRNGHPDGGAAGLGKSPCRMIGRRARRASPPHPRQGQ